MKTYFLFAAFAFGVSAAVQAQPTVDGTLEGDELIYGGVLSVQNTQTQFGDNSDDDLVLTSGGSEINTVYGTVSGGRLHVLVTGNLEQNFNKLEIFIDSVAGGLNTIDGSSTGTTSGLPAGVDGFCCFQTDPNMPGIDNDGNLDGALQRQDGLTFDSGFEADYYLTISNGVENVNGRDQGGGFVDPDEPVQNFWAVGASFADLTNGSAGASGFLGYQTAPRGLPQVLRNPHDVNGDGNIDAADYVQIREGADPNGDGVSDGLDITNWQTNFGTDAGLGGPEFLASADFGTGAQLGSSAAQLPGLSQGQLIDRDYAINGGGGCANDDGDDCLAEELEFALDVASDETDNGSNHRFADNFVDLELALDNSNTGGVDGGTGAPSDPSAVESVMTGIEFSIPLSAIGNPTGDILIFAGINGTGHDFFSNQFAGEGIVRSNLGTEVLSSDPFPITFADIAGDQFVTVSQGASAAVPEPCAAAMLVLAAGFGVTARRR